jgi:phosphatidylserine decarboxylase
MSKHYTSIISDLFGSFAAKRFSPSVQKMINRSYVSLMGLDMHEFRAPESYPSLNALFTRALEVERPIAGGENAVIAPADSLITHFGKIRDGNAYQIKGMEYGLRELLGAAYSGKLESLEGGEFINFYLSPKDYHRYHMPLDLIVKSLTHIPGKIFPVNMPLLRHKRDLFIENERVVLECYDAKDRLHMIVLVGALNVGKMVVTFDDRVKTNSEIREPQHYDYDGKMLKKGELFGWFEMGSTILILSQKGAIKPEVSINQKVKFGEEVAETLP